MTLAEFQALLVSVDPNVTKWKGAATGNYTVWSPYLPLTEESDNQSVVIGYRVQVDRFTKSDSDAIAAALQTVLLASEQIAVSIQQTDYEADTGYLHYIWICEVI